MKLNLWTLCAASATLALAGCGGQGTSDNTASTSNGASSNAASSDTSTSASSGGTKLTGAGATFPGPIYTKWFAAYNAAKGVQVNYQAIGSGGGIQQLKNNTVDFGASDAALSDADLKAMPGETLHIPTVAGAVAVIYNVKGAPADLKLSGEVLADIFMGTIKRWNDAKIAALNAGAKLPDTAIAVAHRSDGSGTTNIFTSYLKAVSPAWATKVGAGKSVNWPVGQGGKGSDGVAAAVQQTPGGIGYAELAYATQNKLSVATIQNKAGKFVLPSVAGTTAAAKGALAAIQKDVRTPIVNAAGADAYPISGFTYILVYKKQKDADKGKALVDLLTWAIHDGQKDAEALSYAPLPPEVVKIDEEALKTVK